MEVIDMIKKSNLISLLFLILLSGNLITAQTFEPNAEQREYYTTYEESTLSSNLLPVLMPFNRWIDPAGEQIYFGDPERENHAMDCALSPDGKWLAIEGRYSVVIISPETKEIKSRFPLNNYFKRQNAMNSFSGIQWQQVNNEYYLYWGTVTGGNKSVVVQARWDHDNLRIVKTISFDAVKPAKVALPNELLVRTENDKKFLYVVLNGNDRVEKIDIETEIRVWSVTTGVAPYGITMAKGKLYVTNWAGSVPDSSDINVAGVPWGKAKVDSLTGATREGTVSVLDPSNGRVLKDIMVGLHPNDIIASPNEQYVYIANANSDMVSVINTGSDLVSEEISVRLLQDKNPYFGDSPNGLGISNDGRILYVTNGMDNALAVVELGRSSSGSLLEKSQLSGFIPTGTYPGAVCSYRDHTLYVANIEAEGARTLSPSGPNDPPAYNSHHMMASVSVIPVPDKDQLEEYTKRVEKANQLFRIDLTQKLPRQNIAPVPVPDRIGEPSLFKHVVYIIKENRTYDQILGDMEAGDGDPDLCIFGNSVTPNTHQLCKDYLLLDNFYVSGKCSAEGHQWTDASIVTDYIEKNMRAWFRSYPHVQTDALVYAPTGFIWDNAVRNNINVRIYGEAAIPKFEKSLNWTSIFEKFLQGKIFDFENITTIKPVEKLLSPNYPAYDGHKIPDVLRAKTFIDELKEYESMPGDQWPELMILALPNDHTGGMSPGLPTPRAMIADNDLALGEIVQAITQSRFWKNTVILVTEDDSQAGWDHVSAYRTVGLVISPYSRLQKTIHTNYNQPSMIRTIEQILGMPPMNIHDATAMPMFDCFSTTPNDTPYRMVPNQVPLNEMNKSLGELSGRSLYYAQKSLEPQFAKIDAGDDDLFNHIIWFAMKGNDDYPEIYSGEDDD